MLKYFKIKDIEQHFNKHKHKHCCHGLDQEHIEWLVDAVKCLQKIIESKDNHGEYEQRAKSMGAL